ncbi:hypothetical protein MMC34_002767 [Xylographa carneopallida]|nr:hypothetical protein [Xylographa carneopallida]
MYLWALFLWQQAVLLAVNLKPFTALAAPVAQANRTEQYSTLEISLVNNNPSILRATISNPTINLVDEAFIADLSSFATSLNSTNAPKVVVFSSANPTYFLGHIDLHLIGANPPPNAAEVLASWTSTLNLLTHLPTIFISELNGHAFSGGNEFILHTDMRFAGPAAKVGAVEVAGGVIHVNGVQQLTRLIGPSYASQHLLASDTVDAQEAARIGWVNAAYSSVEDLRAGVDALATRLATWPANALAATKRSIAQTAPSAAALQADAMRFGELVATPQAQFAIARILELSNDQTDGTFERGLVDDAVMVYE